MELKKMTIQDLRNGIWRCNHRLAFGEYGLMRTEARVREALNQYKDELSKRGQNQLEFKEYYTHGNNTKNL